MRYRNAVGCLVIGWASLALLSACSSSDVPPLDESPPPGYTYTPVGESNTPFDSPTPGISPTPGASPSPFLSPTPGASSPPFLSPTPGQSSPFPDDDQDGDGYNIDTDCDDGDASIYPGATEIPYDSIDQDCDGADLIDVDGDGDTAEEAGGTDCADTNQATWRDAPEIADGKDNDCDGDVDEGLGTKDEDEDGFSEADGDCNDADGSTYPGADEVPYDGIDQDCSGMDLADIDEDGSDGGPTGADCDDQDANIFPGATEVPYDGIDQNCDGADLDDVDGDGAPGGPDGTDCDDQDPGRSPLLEEIPYDGIDQDCDGVDPRDLDGDGYEAIVVGGTDCDDEDETIFPGATEAPYDGIDQDCNGEDLIDADGDGHDVEQAGGDDCNDQDANTYPGATEFADQKDNDCDGLVDEDLSGTDDDGDGYSDATGDCNDYDPTIYPEATEVPYDGIDQDCDGADLVDVDQDGFSGAEGGGDCNDDDAAVHPGAEEIPYDGIDQDCTGKDLTDVDEDGYPSINVTDGTDCDDEDAAIHPDAAEIQYDGIDQDCTGQDLTDVDQDGFDATVVGGTDCNDAQAAIHPDAPEVCDGIDNNCDNVVDRDAIDRATFYVDEDSDGYGNPDNTELACSASGDLVADSTDCDDASDLTYPGADEVCDEADNDCDSDVDEEVQTLYYQDADADGFGRSDVAPDATTLACSLPEGYVLDHTDCNDGDPTIFPGAPETCNLTDDDCDSEVDEGVKTTFYQDLDRDGYGVSSVTLEACTAPSGYAAEDGDCRDTNDTIHPGADERCNEIDDDCDGETDEEVASIFYEDADGDRYGNPEVSAVECNPPAGYVANGNDCDDGDPDVYPGAPEICNKIDDDCDDGQPDGGIDEGVEKTFYRDVDGDGYGDPADNLQECTPPSGYVADGTDCRDTNDAVHPGADEVCNGADDDCDNQIDEGVKITYYQDSDGDGYGNTSASTQACSPPEGYSLYGTDCDDGAAAVHPNAAEVCNGVDDDCDAQVDENVKTTYYADADSDGYGNPSATSRACSTPSGYVSNNQDCDDGNADVYPGSPEVCNGIDDDCDTLVDDGVKLTFYQDADLDGYGNPAVSSQACTAPSGYVSNDQDCRDTNDSINPDATELANGIDDDCDGEIDEGVYFPNCNAIKAYDPTSSSGVYTIDPDGSSGSTSPFQVYCDMVTSGGGWTLVLKANGTSSIFTYDSSYWTSSSTYRTDAPGLDTTEAKLLSYSTVPFNAILVGMLDAGSIRYVDFSITASSMLALVAPGSFTATSIGRSQWKSLMASPSLQPNCNQEGINSVCGGDTKIRIGIVSNQENDCGTCDSRIGVGGYGGYCGQDPSNSVGNEAMCSPDNGDRHTKAFGYVFVR